MVGNPLEWSVLPVGLDKRICTSFNECAVPFYECQFKRIGQWLPFSIFELVVQKHLNIKHKYRESKKVFQLCVEHKYRKPYLRLFLNLLHLRRTSLDNLCY